MLFRAHALLGQGRYAESDRILKAEIARSGNARVPIYTYQFWVDGAFLSSNYEECLRRVDQIPRMERLARFELGHTALWSAIYLGDPNVKARIFETRSLACFPWYPKMFDGVFKLLDGRPGEAEAALIDLQGGFSEAGDVRLWLVRALLAQGKASEARELYDRSVAAYPGEGLDRSLAGVEARQMSGDRNTALVREADALLAVSASKPCTRWKPAPSCPWSSPQRLGFTAPPEILQGAARLRAEALRLAPKSWKAGVDALVVPP